MSRIFACVAALIFISSSAFAQIIYQPVQYQFSSGGSHYYYGGSDRQVHIDANHLSGEASYGRSNGFTFHSGNVDTHREVVTEPARIYTDLMPGQNARFFGYTANDARNAAYANAPTYFRKADALRAAVRQPDGTLLVTSQADAPNKGTIDIRPWKPLAAPAAMPVNQPSPILIIPKRLLDKPLWPRENTTADAR